MKTPAKLYPYLLQAVAGIAVVLFSIAGMARVVGWSPDPAQVSPGMLARDRAGPRCPECSMIVSMRKIEGPEDASGPVLARYREAGDRDATGIKPPTSYEIVVRMADGSSRAINQASPASWQPGESVIVIDGADPSGR